MFNNFWDWLKLVAILGVVAVVIWALIKYKNARPVLLGLIALIIGFSGVYSGFVAWDYYNTHSRVVGELTLHDPYEDFNFYEYDVKDFALQQEDGQYFYEITYATSMEFNGSENKYTLLLNNKPCDKTSSNYGKLNGTTTVHFDDVDGNTTDSIDLSITFTFYSVKIVLRVDTSATQANAGLLEEYFKINGFNLRIIDEVYSYYPILSDKPN